MTVPRGELQSLTILTRLQLVAAEAFPVRFQSISSFTDSMCTLGALEKMSTTLKPYFGNRVSEILQLRTQLAALTDLLPPVHHIPGVGNPADIGTRGNVTMGPSFLKDNFVTWPTTLAGHRASAVIPANEVKRTSATTLAASQLKDQGDQVTTIPLEASEVATPSQDFTTAIYQAIQDDKTLGKSLCTLAKHALQREKLELSVRVLARVLRAVIGGERQLCAQTPTPRWTEFAILVLVRCSSASARDALKQGRLQGLGVVVRSGVVWVQGRVHGEELSRLLGVSELPVLISSEPLARSVLRKAHRSDHRRSPQDIAARSRRLAWIVGAGSCCKTHGEPMLYVPSEGQKNGFSTDGWPPGREDHGLGSF